MIRGLRRWGGRLFRVVVLVCLLAAVPMGEAQGAAKDVAIDLLGKPSILEIVYNWPADPKPGPLHTYEDIENVPGMYVQVGTVPLTAVVPSSKWSTWFDDDWVSHAQAQEIVGIFSAKQDVGYQHPGPAEDFYLPGGKVRLVYDSVKDHPVYGTVPGHSLRAPADLPGKDEPCQTGVGLMTLGAWKYIHCSAFPLAMPAPQFSCFCSAPCPESLCPKVTDPITGLETTDHCPNPADHMNELAVYPTSYFTDRLSIENGVGIDGYDSETAATPVRFDIYWQDRTPPRIMKLDGTQGADFPTLSDPADPTLTVRATTGDWFQTTELKVEDNTQEDCFVKFAIGRIYDIPPSDWVAGEEWEWVSDGPADVVGHGQKIKAMFLPNDCLGVMHYSVFAWDKNGILNPGAPGVVENVPELGYGVSGVGNLGKTVFDAQPFPHTVTPAADATVAVGARKGEGLIHIDDNDYPNLMIRVASSRNPNETLYFPPVSVASYTPNNEEVYNKFLLDALTTKDSIAVGGGVSYVQIVDLGVGNGLSDAEKSAEWRFNNQGRPMGEVFDPDFPKRHFRLEDYTVSDTDKDTGLLLADDATALKTFGERNGFGASATVICAVPLIEDVEYKISLWAEDNVKWMNVPLSGETIPAPYSGIKSGAIAVVDPKQYPKLNVTTAIDPNNFNFETDRLSVIFREPAQKPTGAFSFATYRDKLPHVIASVTDYKGNTRSLVVFFEVTDEKTRIRVLERRHGDRKR